MICFTVNATKEIMETITELCYYNVCHTVLLSSDHNKKTFQSQSLPPKYNFVVSRLKKPVLSALLTRLFHAFRLVRNLITVVISVPVDLVCVRNNVTYTSTIIC